MFYSIDEHNYLPRMLGGHYEKHPCTALYIVPNIHENVSSFDDDFVADTRDYWWDTLDTGYMNLSITIMW